MPTLLLYREDILHTVCYNLVLNKAQQNPKETHSETLNLI